MSRQRLITVLVKQIYSQLPKCDAPRSARQNLSRALGHRKVRPPDAVHVLPVLGDMTRSARYTLSMEAVARFMACCGKCIFGASNESRYEKSTKARSAEWCTRCLLDGLPVHLFRITGGVLCHKRVHLLQCKPASPISLVNPAVATRLLCREPGVVQSTFMNLRCTLSAHSVHTQCTERALGCSYILGLSAPDDSS